MESKTIIVTGASRGIGYETALALAEQKHTVIVVARSEKQLTELKRHYNDRIDAQPTDLTDDDQINRLLDHIEQQYESVDIVINNAGGLINKPFTELTDQDWQKMIDLNLMTAIKLVRALHERLSNGAHIVNISSMGGFQGSSKFPGLTAYSVAKGGLSILTECLTAEFADRNIKSNCLCLGAVQTEMLEEAFPGMKAPVSAKEMGSYVANFALNGSTYYNGKVLPVALSDPE